MQKSGSRKFRSTDAQKGSVGSVSFVMCHRALNAARTLKSVLCIGSVNTNDIRHNARTYGWREPVLGGPS